MSFLHTLSSIAHHPLNADMPVRALLRFARWQISSRIALGPVIVPFVNDAVLAVTPGMSAATGNIYCGLYGFEEMGFLLHVLRTEHLFVDVGANIGAYTVLAGAAAGAPVISFEPVPSTFADLRRNIRLNGLEPSCEAHNAGVAGENGTMTFTNNEGATNHVVVGGGAQVANTVSVPVRTLDDVIGTRMPVVAKIDAEGFETEVLKGASAFLAKPSLLAVIIQLNGRGRNYGYDEDAIDRRILESGFKPHRYHPFERNLVEQQGKNPGRYTLYCREADQIRALVQSAPRYQVRGCAL